MERTKYHTIVLSAIKTADQARQIAIYWQHWQADERLTLGELSDWNEYFTEVAHKFGLVEEFEENGVI
jgi:hypothetical protein